MSAIIAAANEQKQQEHIFRTLNLMEKDQLIQLVMGLTSSSPAIRSQIHDSLPRPSLETISNVLQKLERRLMEAFPYNKDGQDKSDYAYNRVKPVLLEIKGNFYTLIKSKLTI